MNNNEAPTSSEAARDEQEFCDECGEWVAALVGKWNLCEDCDENVAASEAADNAMDVGR